jgi:hypothetical protein
MVDSDENILYDLSMLRSLMQKYIQMVRANYTKRAEEFKRANVSLRSFIDRALILVPDWSDAAQADMLKSTKTTWCSDDIGTAWFDLMCIFAQVIRDRGIGKAISFEEKRVRIADDVYNEFLEQAVEDVTTDSEDEEGSQEEYSQEEEGTSGVAGAGAHVPSAPPASPAATTAELPRGQTHSPASIPATTPAAAPAATTATVPAVGAEVPRPTETKPRARREKEADPNRTRKLFGGVKGSRAPEASRGKAAGTPPAK